MCRRSLFLLFACQLANASLAAEPSRPNIVLVISDDQAWTDYGFMGHPHIDTPRLDRLAAESLTFTRGYVASPLCRPSLASILTGLPTHLHGTAGNDPATGDQATRAMSSRSSLRHQALHEALYQRLRALPNLVRLLRDAGYETMQTGKWWESDPQTFGFTRAMTHGDPLRGGRHGDAGLKIAREGLAPIRSFLDSCTANAAENNAGECSRPFFIWHAPLLPHTPHNPPSELYAKYKERAPTQSVAKYWAMCEWFDRTCGELLDELDDRGLARNTLVIYVTDNGWIQDPERANAFAARSKTTPYEGGVRTPLMVRWPAQISPDHESGLLVSTIDIAPTILRAAGLGVPATMPGIDLRDRVALASRDAVFGADFTHDIPDVERPWKGLESRYVVSRSWKLIAHAGGASEVELYHVEADPHERANLASQRSDVVEKLQGKLAKWWTGKEP